MPTAGMADGLPQLPDVHLPVSISVASPRRASLFRLCELPTIWAW